MKVEYLSDLSRQYSINPISLNRAHKSPLEEKYENQSYIDDSSDVNLWKKVFEENINNLEKDVDCPGFGKCDFSITKKGRTKYYNFYKIDWNNLKEIKNLWTKGNLLHKQDKNKYICWFFWEPFKMDRKLPIRNDLDEFRLKCSVDDNLSPYDAWYDKPTRIRAELNLADQIGFGGECFEKYISRNRSIELSILERFTTSKLAPRVTAMSPKEAIIWLMTSPYKNDILKIQPGKLRKGFYDPCAGFPGRSIAAAQLNAEYEGYDVNPMMIKYSNASFRDLIMMDPVETDKVVFTSPPWENRETWPNDNLDACQGGGGMDAENSFSFPKFWWYTLIIRKVKSSLGYLLVNGCDNQNQPGLDIRVAGLFGQRSKTRVLYTAEDGDAIRKLCDQEGLGFSIEDNNRAHEICLQWMKDNYDGYFKIE